MWEVGREEFVTKGKKDKIRRNRNFVKVVDGVAKGWVVQAGGIHGVDSPVAFYYTTVDTHWIIDITFKYLCDRSWD